MEISRERLVGWVNRFATRNAGLAGQSADDHRVTLTGGDGTTADIAVPLPPMSVRDRDPLEALLDHLDNLGTLAIILVRGGAHSIGLARDGLVLTSSTDRQYLQGRTAAGGWSQQRYARRRGNQLTASLEHAADLAARVLGAGPSPAGVILGGDPAAVERVLADRRLAGLLSLPRRDFPDIPEPRRAVLDEIAARSTTVEITIRPPAGSRTAAAAAGDH